MKGGKKLSFPRRIFKFFKYRILKLLIFRKNRPTIHKIRDRYLIVLPNVFHPGLYNTSVHFAESIDKANILEEDYVLDLGTGSGIGAVFAAKYSKHVVATDINPFAVECARANAALNNSSNRIDVRLGSMFEPVTNEKFDLILYTPPFYMGKPRNWHERAFRGGEDENHVCHIFFRDVSKYLKPNGRVRMLWSTIADYSDMEKELKENNLLITNIDEKDITTEVLLIYEIKQSGETV